MHPPTHSRGQRRPRLAGLLLFLLTVLLAGILPLPAYAVTPPVLEAPPETAEIWIDVESDAARTGVTSVSWRAGSGPWTDAALSQTVFGSTGTAQISEGTHEVRFSVASRIAADVVVSFTDAAGAVLAEHRIREAVLDPKQATDGGISWKDLAEGPVPDSEATIPAPVDGTTGNSTTENAASPATHTGEPKSLGKTGISASFLALVLGTAAALTGAGLYLLQRRKRIAPALDDEDER